MECRFCESEMVSGQFGASCKRCGAECCNGDWTPPPCDLRSTQAPPPPNSSTSLLERRLRELERRIRELEARPVYLPYPYPYTSPIYPDVQPRPIEVWC